MIILYNGTIHNAKPGDSAICIDNSQIRFIGPDQEILSLARSGCRKIDLKGNYILPGLTDAHLHLDLFSQSLNNIDCNTNSLAECLQRIQSKIGDLQPGQWAKGHGWNQNQWKFAEFNIDDLDQVTADHPAFLTDHSLHSAWVNSRALQLAGVDDLTKDPSGGKIVRNENGKPTGILLESAVELVEKILPKPTLQDRKVSILRGQRELHKLGITGIHDFDREDCFSALQELDAEESLTLRVVKSIPVENLEHAVRVGLRSDFGSAHLRIGSVKMFADGALGPQTAAMFRPYEGDPQNIGTLLLTADEIFETGIKATGAGLSLAIHAIGDRAVNETLNGLAMVREYEYQHYLPIQHHRVEHLQLFHPDDITKVAALKLCASMQPIHLYADMSTADRYWGERAQNAFAFHSLAKLNTLMVFGSDAPVESANPFWGIHAAVTRSRQDHPHAPNGWNPEERISVDQAIDAYSINPAIQSNQAGQLGSIATGKWADLVIIDQNPSETPPDSLYTIKPLAVFSAGKCVYQDPEKPILEGE